MLENQFQKAVDLSRKTGDRLIVFDRARPESAHVILSLDEYEKLLFHKTEVRDLTEKELLDKINRDIAIWRSEQKDSFYFSADEEKPVKKLSDVDFHNMEDEDEDIANYEDVEDMMDDWDDEEEDFKEDLENGKPSYVRAMENKTASTGEARRDSPRWKIPDRLKKKAEEVVEDQDRQYLEEIVF
jgi:hypothetical protein